MCLQNLYGRIGKKITGFYIVWVLLTLCLIPIDGQTRIFVFCIGSFSISALILYLFTRNPGNFSNPCVCFLFSAIAAVFVAVALTLMYQSSVLQNHRFSSLLLPSGLLRIYLLFWPINIINYYIIFDASKVSDFLFRHRWKFAIFFSFVLILAKVHFSNVSCFSYFIQPECETVFSMPLFGTLRTIRSDEWMINIPRNIVAEHSNYGKFNYLLRGTENYNIASSGLYLSYSALSNLFNLGYYLFGSEYGLSFYTVTCFIFSFMIAFEFSYIISDHKRLPALLGACLIGLSQFSLWWSMVLQIPAMLTIVVCAYYFFESDSSYRRVFFAAGIALSGAMFICNLYPAWQVPFAYIILALLMWVFTVHWNRIKALQKNDWLVILCAFAFMCSVIIAYLYNIQAYATAVMATEYPGARFSTGGYSINRLLTYPASLLYPYKDTGNNSEAGTFFNLFPLPILFSAWILLQNARRYIKNERETCCDTFLCWLMIPALFFLIFCTTGIPVLLSKYTLMSFSTDVRCADALGLINVFLLIRILGGDHYKIPTGICSGIIIFALLWALNTTEAAYPHFMPTEYIVFISICIILFGIAAFGRINQSKKTWIMLAITVLIATSGLSVLPVTRGLDGLLKKPVSPAIQEIVNENPNAKWIALGELRPAQFLVANGASTINSNNYIPNMELWKKLDPDGSDNEVYNRYCHVDVMLTENATDFELIGLDYIKLNLSYSDLKTAEVQYIFSTYPISGETEAVDFNLLYDEYDAYIYEVIYPD